MPTINYSTLSLNGREQIFLKSVLIIHNGRSEYFWEENNSEFNVLIVGRDVDLDQPIKVDPQVKAVLTFSADIRCQHPYIYKLGSPVKATELIEHFKAIEGIANNQPVQNQVEDTANTTTTEPSIDMAISRKNRLLRWPRAELLEQNKVFFILAALLSKGAMSLDELVEVSGKPKEVCEAFLTVLINSGDIESIDIAVLGSAQKEQKAPVQRSLLDRIRSSLGIFQK